MLITELSDESLIKELLKQLRIFNSILIEYGRLFDNNIIRGNYFYAFDPSGNIDAGIYEKDIRLIRAINEVLDENLINVKCLGYTYLREAAFIITDLRSLDVCLDKDVYPLISDKYRIDDKRNIEHCIRNALDSAYRTYLAGNSDHTCIMQNFDRRPTNKPFILQVVREVEKRIL